MRLGNALLRLQKRLQNTPKKTTTKTTKNNTRHYKNNYKKTTKTAPRLQKKTTVTNSEVYIINFTVVTSRGLFLSSLVSSSTD